MHQPSFCICVASIILENPAGRDELKNSALCWPPSAVVAQFFFKLWIEDCEICATEQMVFISHNIAQNNKIIYWPRRCTFAVPHEYYLSLIGFSLNNQRHN